MSLYLLDTDVLSLYQVGQAQVIQNLFGLLHVQVFIKLAVNLHHRCRRTGRETFKFDR